MKANQLATLVLRLLGIFCLVQVIPAVTVSSYAVPIVFSGERLNGSEIMMVLLVVLFLAFQIGLGVLLIVKSAPWGEKLTPQNTGAMNFTAVSFEQVQVLAFAVAGALILASALPQLLNSMYAIIISLREINGGNQYRSNTTYSWHTLLIAVGTLLKAAFGAWMFFGARGFANFWRSMRNFGTPKPPQS